MGLGKIITYINWVDIIVLILFFRTCYVGFTRGLGNELMPLIITFTSLVLSLQFYKALGGYIAGHTPLSHSHAYFLIFILIVIITIILTRVIMRILVGKSENARVATLYDSGCGLFFGILRGILLVSFVMYALWLAPSKYVSSSVSNGSILGKTFLKIGPKVHQKTMSVFRRG
ncbi:MAG: CvpA family protein [Candidatus Omnitrophota bacterium]